MTVLHQSNCLQEAAHIPSKLVKTYAKVIAGQKYKHGWQYELSGNENSPIPHSGDQLTMLKDPGPSIGGFRDADELQSGPRQSLAPLALGRKRAATSMALGSDSCSKTLTICASRADFPEDHWKESQSNVLPPTPVAPTPPQHTALLEIASNDSSPMRINTPLSKGKGKAISTKSSPINSSPISQNALLQARCANDAWLGNRGLHGPGSNCRLLIHMGML
jgi:hypothetical protein